MLDLPPEVLMPPIIAERDRLREQVRVLREALQGCVEALEAAGADGEPGDMPAPILEQARAALTHSQGE